LTRYAAISRSATEPQCRTRGALGISTPVHLADAEQRRALSALASGGDEYRRVINITSVIGRGDIAPP